MRVRREVSSIRHRSAGETWQKIIQLVTGPGTKDLQHLKNASGVMGSIITDEHPASRAIIVEGVGPQLRIYCRYGKEAVEEGDSVDVISWNARRRASTYSTSLKTTAPTMRTSCSWFHGSKRSTRRTMAPRPSFPRTTPTFIGKAKQSSAPCGISRRTQSDRVEAVGHTTNRKSPCGSS